MIQRDWLAALPSCWKAQRADAVLDYRKLPARAADFESVDVFHYSIPAIQETGDGIAQPGAEIESDKISLDGGELIVSKLNPRKGCVLLTRPQTLPIVCSTEFVPLVARSGFDSRFAFYVYTSTPVRELISAVVQSVTRSHQRANPEDITKLWIPVPPLAQQRAIADYLDSETARLDALVAVKERVLGLLAEKRLALITRAVTRGLDLRAPLRDSGVPWLGEIPAHWCMTRLKHFASIYYGLSQPPDYVDFGVPFLRATNVKRGALSSEGLAFVDEADVQAARVIRLRSGDIIVVRSGAYTGDSAIVTNDWQGAVAGYDMVVRVWRSVDPEFVAMALLCQYVLEAQIDPLRHRAAQPHLNAEELGNIVFALPPLNDQRRIVAQVSEQARRLEEVATATRRSVSLLTERRAALIAAAVTGQIDVGHAA